MFPQDAALLIPQQQPFVMVDELVYADELVARCTFVVKADNPLVSDGLFQEGGLLENMAQTAAAHAGYIALSQNKPVLPGFIASVKDLEIYRLPAIGDRLITEISIGEHMMGFTIVHGAVRCDEIPVASCELRIRISDETAG